MRTQRIERDLLNRKYVFAVVEDDKETSEIVRDVLAAYYPGSEVRCFGNSGEFFDYIENEERTPDFLYLDRMLPDCNGDRLLTQIRGDKNYKYFPIMIVTAYPTDSNEALNLMNGADDYLRKPLSPERFIARTHALLRNYERRSESASEGKDVLCYGDFVIDAPKVKASYKGKPCELTTMEFRLLHFLASNERNVFTRDRLLSKVWAYEYSGDNRTVDVTVSRTRKKIKEVATDIDAESCITTRRGSGYSFDPSVFLK